MPPQPRYNVKHTDSVSECVEASESGLLPERTSESVTMVSPQIVAGPIPGAPTIAFRNLVPRGRFSVEDLEKELDPGRFLPGAVRKSLTTNGMKALSAAFPRSV